MLIDNMFARDMYQVYKINDDWLIDWFRWVTTTEDYGVKTCGHEMSQVAYAARAANYHKWYPSG